MPRFEPASVPADSSGSPADSVPPSGVALPEDGLPPGPPALRPDTSRVIEVGRPRRQAPAPPSRFNQPRWVMLRSLAVPGWGQVHNGQWLKAAAVATVQTLLIIRMIDDDRALDDLQAQVDQAQRDGDADREVVLAQAFNDRLDVFVARQWFFGGVLAYSLLDAYVDAHFRHFDVQFEEDPVFPGGAPGVRVSMRWRF